MNKLTDFFLPKTDLSSFVVGSQVALKPYPSIFHEIIAALRMIKPKKGKIFKRASTQTRMM